MIIHCPTPMLGFTMNDHYFSAIPASADARQDIQVDLCGRSVTMTTAAGTFSPARLDLGTAVLLNHLPEPPAEGRLLDLGCGWGPLAVHAALESPGLEVWAVDVNERALDLVGVNARRLGLENIHPATSEAVPEGEFAAIWSNPPIKIGKEALHALLLAWLPRLSPGGTAWLVVARKLGADSLLPWLQGALGDGFDCRRHASGKGYRILRVERLATSA